MTESHKYCSAVGSFAFGEHFGQVFFADGCNLKCSEGVYDEQCGKPNHNPYPKSPEIDGIYMDHSQSEGS